MLVRIPVYYNRKTDKALKFEELELPLPDGEDEYEKQQDVMFINPNIVEYIECNMDDNNGSYISIGNEFRIETPLSVQEAAKIINEAFNK